MYTTLLTDATLFDALIAIDQELAATAQAGGCRLCAGRLDHADYPRKPRGGPATLSAAYEKRASFCCDKDGCRQRLTPVSVRFLGRRVYLGVVVLLACVLRQGPTPWRVSRLHGLMGVSARTLARWHRWWRDAFVHTAFWKAARSRFARPVEADDLPRDLLDLTDAPRLRWGIGLRWRATRAPRRTRAGRRAGAARAPARSLSRCPGGSQSD